MDVQAPPRGRTGSGRSWAAWTVAGVVAIWAAVLLISLLTPDMVSGSHQERLPVAAFGTWLWGLIATGVFLGGMHRLRRARTPAGLWVGLAIAVSAVWLVATVLSIFLPVFVTGSDPTRIPIAGLVSPVGAMVLTVLASITAAVLAASPWDSPPPQR
jgi:hypothetical protein